MKAEAYGRILCAQIQTKTSKPIGWHFIIQQDNKPKHIYKGTKELFLKKWTLTRQRWGLIDFRHSLIARNLHKNIETKKQKNLHFGYHEVICDIY